MKLIDLINVANDVNMVVQDTEYGWTVKGNENGLATMLAERWLDATVRSFDFQGDEMVINVEEDAENVD
jgi:hypothetical protein